MRSRLMLVLLAALSVQGCTFNFPLFPGPGPLQETQVSGTGKPKVLLLDISGVISSQDEDGLAPTPNMIAGIKEQLTRATQDEAVKGFRDTDLPLPRWVSGNSATGTHSARL